MQIAADEDLSCCLCVGITRRCFTIITMPGVVNGDNRDDWTRERSRDDFVKGLKYGTCISFKSKVDRLQ